MSHDCPECHAKNSVAGDDTTGMAVCCACGLMVTIERKKKRPSLALALNVASPTSDTSDPELPPLKKWRGNNDDDDHQGQIVVAPILLSRGNPGQSESSYAPLVAFGGSRIHSTSLDLEAASRGGGTLSMGAGSAAFDGSAVCGVFQNAMNPNRPLHLSKRGRESQPLGPAGSTPSNLRGSVVGQRGFANAQRIVSTLLNRLGLANQEQLNKAVMYLLQEYLGGNWKGGEMVRTLAGGATYYVARLHNLPITLLDVAEACLIGVDAIGRAFSRIYSMKRESQKTQSQPGELPPGLLPVVDPGVLVPRVVTKLWDLVSVSSSKRETSAASAQLPVSETPHVVGPSLFLRPSDASTMSQLDVAWKSHAWMSRCPYDSRTKLTEASMRLVSIATAASVSGGRSPAAVAVAAVALAARLPVSLHRIRHIPRGRHNEGPRTVKRNARTEPLDVLAATVLVASDTARKRYAELRSAVLRSCKTILPWGDLVSADNLEEHIPDLVEFETTNRLLKMRAKEDEHDEATLQVASRVSRMVPTVRDSRASSSSQPSGFPPIEPKEEVPSVDHKRLVQANSDTAVVETDYAAPKSFRRGDSLRRKRDKMVDAALIRIAHPDNHGSASLTPKDVIVERLLRAGCAEDVVRNGALNLSHPSRIDRIIVSFSRPTTDELESDDSEDLLNVLSDDEHYVRSEQESSVFKELWDRRLVKPSGD